MRDEILPGVEQALLLQCEELARARYRTPSVRVEVALELEPDDDTWRAQVVEERADGQRSCAATRVRMTRYHRGSREAVLEALRDGLLRMDSESSA